MFQALQAALEFCVRQRQLDAERGGLAVDAMAAANRNRILVLEGALLKRRHDGLDIGVQNVRGTDQLNIQAGIEHI